jgi:hypothetical protein
MIMSNKYQKKMNRQLHRQDGFSLWELSLVILIMIGLFVALVNIMPLIVKRTNVEVDNQALVKLDEQLLGFVAAHSRLPCPASSTNYTGLEDCGLSTGAIPYKTLGLNEDYAGVGSIPIMYAVFRNSTDSADLANITNLFNPTDSHSDVTSLTNINGLDFCSAITNAKASTFSANYAHIVLPNGTTSAVPYVIVTAGSKDADGTSGAFDGVNSTATLDFNAPNTTHNANYDDFVFSRSFDELASTLNCDTAQNSLNLLADAKATHTENVTQAQSLKEAAELAIIITIMQTALGVANTAMAVYNLAIGAALIGVASAALSTAIAACVASLGTACGLVAWAVAGLVATIVGVIAAGVSVGLNIAALVAQTIAIVKTIDVANRAGSTVSVPNPNNSTNTTGTVTSNEDLAADARTQAEEMKKEAADKTISARNSVNSAISMAAIIRNRFFDIRTLTQTLVATNGAVADATFSSNTIAANNQVSTNYNQAVITSNNLSLAKVDADAAVTALGASVTTQPNPPFGPFVTTYPNIDFATVLTKLEATDTKMTLASDNFTLLTNSFGNSITNAINARDRIIAMKNAYPPIVLSNPPNPTAAEAAAIAARDARFVILNDAQAKAQAVIDNLNATTGFNYFDVLNKRNAAVNTRNETQGFINDLVPLPADASPDEVTNRANLLADLNASINRLNIVIANFNAVLSSYGPFDIIPINSLSDNVEIENARIQEALGKVTDAYKSIQGAEQLEESATELENGIGGDNPAPTTTVLTLNSGVDAILEAADSKGVEK